MKISIVDLAHKYEIQSTGTASDPIIFDYIDFSDLPRTAGIKNSTLYIQFESCIFKGLRIVNSENITFKNCEMSDFSITNSKNIRIENSEFITGLELRSCTQLEISSTRIHLLHFNGCFENIFRDCTISYTINSYSRGNVFENTHFLKRDEYNLIHGGKKPPLLFGIIALIIVFIFTFDLLARYANEFGLMVIILSIITFIVIFIVTLYMIFHSMKIYRKSKKYPPNKVL